MLGKYSHLGIFGSIAVTTIVVVPLVRAQVATPKLYISFPPANYQTASDRIFLIGSAPSEGKVSVNNKLVPRSQKGHFASVFNLKVGKNTFEVDYKGQTKTIVVTRAGAEKTPPPKDNFAPNSLEPQGDMARMPGELVCFGANAPTKAKVQVNVAGQDIPLKEQINSVELPDNKAALIDRNQPQAMYGAGQYLGCAIAAAAADLGNPTYKLEVGNPPTTVSQSAPGKIQILSPTDLDIAEVTVENGIARTGPGSDFSRLTPLPKGTQASITARQTGNNNGKQTNWVRLDYGGWILAEQVRITSGVTVPPKTIVKSLTSKERDGATDVTIPLQVPVPITLEQGTNTLTLTLYNTTAQTDIIRFNDNPTVSRLDWKQLSPGVVQYVFNLKSRQQWGYKLRYQGSNLVLSLRHPPKLDKSNPLKPLAGTKILLDPGHGGKDPGAVGPNGYTEKEANLYASKLLANELAMRGAAVYLSRESDKFIELSDRQAIIDNLEPTIALSVHHNSLPDGGNPDTKGFSTFWYHAQAQSLAMYLHNYVVKDTGRPSYGVFWDNLALARPVSSPSVLLEWGFMSNPSEFELIATPEEQQKMAKSIADGVTQWMLAATK
ncbi:N-acetylmuramoyl-L-alanine amidase [Chamaesiphon minutus]|uniref:N-acetylmuramoyl-L-alanine amidase n=1 Tax=Chamaesiphon minutus (strain ATCC 27169 / PCC 6605) TaxID=1173020 RepID=K9UK79_CHAP6|nr:N-acetylmuramoyl-L-alanine amidase [Chamaesiphon minutus]AFY95507.1 N-acetylmuramoyl-L-alanine amidase [Chamaesiphon minutus PCC 6605]